jgi:uncharacterized membrane protein HdeD (DUF308 family)
VVDAFVEQLTIASVALAIFGVVTFLLGTASLYSLYAPTGGGVFFIGFFTIIAGIILAFGVFLRTVVRTERFQTPFQEIINSVSNQLALLKLYSSDIFLPETTGR